MVTCVASIDLLDCAKKNTYKAGSRANNEAERRTVARIVEEEKITVWQERW